MRETADILWWIFLVTVLAVVLLVSGLAVAMARAQRRVIALHRSYLQRLVRAHEDERSRIARDVHDDAVQRLTLISRELDTLVGDGRSSVDTRVHRLVGINGEVRDLADALRQLAHQLHPAALEHAGLTVALSQLTEEVARAHAVTVRFDQRTPEPSLHADARLALFRITQEALSNAVRHSDANDITVTLRAECDMIELEVRDSGRGFDPRDVSRRGIGLVGIAERARLAGGTAIVLSAPNEGTRVIARVTAIGSVA